MKIATMEKVKVGGVDQWLVLSGRDASKPGLLFLHGGPGTPETAFLHHFNRNLENHFIVVAWEQRGAGKSYAPGIPPESMTLEQFVRDAHEVTQVVKQRFGREKLYLVGHSWGAILGILTAHRYPEDYAAYVGVSQPVTFAENEAISYQWALDTAIARKNRRAIRELQAIGAPVDGRYAGGFEAWLMKGKWIRAFGGALYGKDALPVLGRILLLSPDYALRDKVNYLRGEQFTLTHMAEALMQMDLRQQVAELGIPCYFCHGRHDYQALCSLAEGLFRQIEAPRKRFVAWENTAHGALFEQPARFLELMLEIVGEVPP
jgi:pimeloyl-ACP methyl ester carboxylesterase